MRKTISFTENYEEEFEYLCNQTNASEYVCRLIRQDILKPKENIEDKIFKMLQQIVHSKNLKVEAPSENIELKKRAAGKLLSLGK